MYTVYILYSKGHDSFYIGYSSDVDRRLTEHNTGLNKSTKHKRPWIIVYTEKFTELNDAIKRERFLKKQKSKLFYKRISNMDDTIDH